MSVSAGPLRQRIKGGVVAAGIAVAILAPMTATPAAAAATSGSQMTICNDTWKPIAVKMNGESRTLKGKARVFANPDTDWSWPHRPPVEGVDFTVTDGECWTVLGYRKGNPLDINARVGTTAPHGGEVLSAANSQSIKAFSSIFDHPVAVNGWADAPIKQSNLKVGEVWTQDNTNTGGGTGWGSYTIQRGADVARDANGRAYSYTVKVHAVAGKKSLLACGHNNGMKGAGPLDCTVAW
jgi:hypothetical protein